ncbi:MAG: FxsA family protein [Planctomycetales bacterium]|nr:FxsA family protein [Planctomycetales bacterium]
MPFLLLFLFIVVPLSELALLLWIAEHTHWAFPLAVVIATGIAGVALMRVQGVLTLRRLRRMGADGSPVDPMIDAGFLALAAGLLITPGVVTDAVGLSLLFPPTRALWRAGLKRWFHNRLQFGQFQFMQFGGPFQHAEHGAEMGDDDDDIIEGHVVNRDE